MFKLKLKNILIIAALGTLPTLGFAAKHTIKVINSSSTAVTASMKGTCSNSLGRKGVLQPGDQYPISPHLINMTCALDTCKIVTYASKDCTGEQIATIEASAMKDDGVVSITQHNKDKYTLEMDAHYNYVKLMDKQANLNA